MEHCIAPPISTLPKLSTINTTAISAGHLRRSSSPTPTHAGFPRLPLLRSRSHRFINLSVAAFDKTSGKASSYVAVEENDKADAYKSGSRPIEGEVVVPGEEGVQEEESSSSASASDSPFDDFLANLNVKLEDDAYSVFLYGGTALFTVWLASAVVGAIDTIPLFPKLMEVVGVGYSIWFTYRYLLFKKDRDELFGITERFKQEILGSKDG